MKPATVLRLFSVLILPLAGLILSASVWGEIPDETELIQARQQFLDAEKALKEDQLQTYRGLKRQLRRYPLLPYLEYQELTKHLSSRSPEAIKASLQQLADTPLSDRLRGVWLDQLAKQRRWQTYLQFSRAGGSVTRQCQRLQAMIATGQHQEAFAKVPAIWLSGSSRPTACDPVFQAWIEAGQLSTELVWQRIELAMAKGRTRLTGYLKRFLPASEQAWVDRWIALHRQPNRLVWLTKEGHTRRDKIIVHSIRRLARTDAAQALTLWQQFQNDSVFSDRQHLQVARSLAARLVQEPDKQLSERLASLVPEHLRLDPKLSDKQFQMALQHNDWNRVLLTIDTLSAEQQQKSRWRYWRARALLQLGQGGEAKQLLEALAKERSYYGFLAADRLGDGFSFMNESLIIPAQQLRHVAAMPGLVRARELKVLGRLLEARREWNLALQSLNTDELRAAAKLAQTWDWPSQAIITLAKIRDWNDLELRFPLAYREQVDQHAKVLGLDSAWIYAILRQESAFVSDARSGAGAMGLMQLMPRTARQVASRSKRAPLKTNDLFHPKVNIELGSNYLNEVYRKLQENPVLATAAYNAGPSRVLGWLPEETQPTDIWIETVPFRETREYLKRVLAYTLIYAHRMGENTERLPMNWLKPIKAIDQMAVSAAKPDSDV